MSETEHVEIAACGLDCGSCPIRKLPFDKESAGKDIPRFKKGNVVVTIDHSDNQPAPM